MPSIGKMALDPAGKIRGKMERRLHKAVGLENLPTPSDINASIMGESTAKKISGYEPKSKPAAPGRSKKKLPYDPDKQGLQITRKVASTK